MSELRGKHWVQYSIKEWRYQTLKEEGPEIHGKVIATYEDYTDDTIYVAKVKNVHKEEYGFSIKFHLKRQYENFVAAQTDVSQTVRALERLDSCHKTLKKT